MEPVNTRNAAQAARAYISIMRWPVLVGHRHRPRQGCTCGDIDCVTPGAHPLPGPMDCPDEQTLARQLAAAPGASLIAPTTTFDALVVPHRVGMSAMVALDRVAPVPCLIEGQRAILLVLPSTGRYAFTEPVSAQVRTGPDTWIALPPTHGVRWDTHPWIDYTAKPLSLLHGRDVGRFLMEAFKSYSPSEEVPA